MGTPEPHQNTRTPLYMSLRFYFLSSLELEQVWRYPNFMILSLEKIKSIPAAHHCHASVRGSLKS
jgi:hypothetical protein